MGQQLALSHVMVIERRVVNEKKIRLVADFRPDHARVAATLSATDMGDGGRTRPAA